ncbi:universal stress protein [Actinomadura harenae]|uniref:Universal stress protein n=1 Tax=Actinomadura harenae TaxID=2483351 RepID=A0A3M2LZD8_9ACTN|nr:universal stress protein [Actinomadura harenae]RMI42841.1 universal stress protein [Actinomadura harenae]
MSWGSSILVGYDATPDGERALRWAATEAKLRRLPLSVCHAWRWPYPVSYIDNDGAAIVRRMGQNLLDQGVLRVRDFAPTVTVQAHLADGPADAALLHLAGEAEMIVVGAHDREDMALGSTALRLPARAERPVVVVRPGGGDGEHRRVVAGFDGSSGSDAALAFAFEEAAVRGWTLRVVYGCWEPSAASEDELNLFADRERLRQVRGAELEQAVASWSTKYPQVDVQTALTVTPPREAMFEAAETADLVVVGRRGAGSIGRLRVGATTTAMLMQAPCAVVVVPPAAEI